MMCITRLGPRARAAYGGSMRHPHGFTLIELLVVISIIGFLASVVLSSLASARSKGHDARIMAEANQLRNIMEEESINSRTYAAIKSGGGWYDNTGAACSGFTGSYATQAKQTCDDIVAQEKGANCTTQCLYFKTTTPDSPGLYSIVAYLPGASAQVGSARYYCVGVSGKTSIGPAGTWTGLGCTANP